MKWTNQCVLLHSLFIWRSPDTELSPKAEGNLGMGLGTSEYKMNNHMQKNPVQNVALKSYLNDQKG